MAPIDLTWGTGNAMRNGYYRGGPYYSEGRLTHYSTSGEETMKAFRLGIGVLFLVCAAAQADVAVNFHGRPHVAANDTIMMIAKSFIKDGNGYHRQFGGQVHSGVLTLADWGIEASPISIGGSIKALADSSREESGSGLFHCSPSSPFCLWTERTSCGLDGSGFTSMSVKLHGTIDGVSGKCGNGLTCEMYVTDTALNCPTDSSYYSYFADATNESTPVTYTSSGSGVLICAFVLAHDASYNYVQEYLASSNDVTQCNAR